MTVNGGRVPTTAQGQGPHTYAISFTPRQAIAHTVDLRFNGKDVPGKCVLWLIVDFFRENGIIFKILGFRFSIYVRDQRSCQSGFIE